MNKKAAILLAGLLILTALACSFSPLMILKDMTGRVQENPTATPNLSTDSLGQETNASNEAASGNLDLLEKEQLIIDLYERVIPGVVSIQTLTAEGGELGSGFVYDDEGHIVTNYHVVENATDLEVDFASGYKTRGKVIATDLDSDLAIIKVDVPAQELVPLVLADSDALQIGQTVIAIGNPFGLTGSITMGIVSAKGRTLSSFRESVSGGFFSAGDLIQTDAAINPGNSGGPLLNLNGEIVGVNRAIRTESTNETGDPTNSGIGFAISSNIIRRVVPFLISQGFYDYPYVGVTSQDDFTLIEREALNIEETTGAYIISVVENSPADKAGLQGGSEPSALISLFAGGDLIIEVDGRPVRVFGDLLGYLMVNKSPGDQITIKYIRDGQVKETVLTLEKRP
jgi:2-alkenal reductase